MITFRDFSSHQSDQPLGIERAFVEANEWLRRTGINPLKTAPYRATAWLDTATPPKTAEETMRIAALEFDTFAWHVVNRRLERCGIRDVS